jgi:hypothetical protein
MSKWKPIEELKPIMKDGRKVLLEVAMYPKMVHESMPEMLSPRTVYLARWSTIDECWASYPDNTALQMPGCEVLRFCEIPERD